VGAGKDRANVEKPVKKPCQSFQGVMKVAWIRVVSVEVMRKGQILPRL
jgi:hypothetical protein